LLSVSIDMSGSFGFCSRDWTVQRYATCYALALAMEGFVRVAPSRRRSASDGQPAKGLSVSSFGRQDISAARSSIFSAIVLLLVVTRARYVRRVLTACRLLRSLGSKGNNREETPATLCSRAIGR